MTKLCYDGSRWTTDQKIFGAIRRCYGPLATWQSGQTFGGTSAYALLGPDIEMPGGRTNYKATALGPGWEVRWPHASPGPGPDFSFTEDTNQSWKRGHLLNGEWGGRGDQWTNLTALTAKANSNHKTLEQRIRNYYLTHFRQFDMDTSGGQIKGRLWFALQYWVQVSRDPWAMAPSAGNLYSYCPNKIRVTWRVVTLKKPVGTPGGRSSGDGFIRLTRPTLNSIPLDYPSALEIKINMPNIQAITLPPALACTPANVADLNGPVYDVPPNAPPIPNKKSLYDGSVEIFQD